MMREIKFRAWIDNSMVYELGTLNLCELQDCKEDGFDGSEFIPMQYTGLKDKNGKEIYEGDLIDDQIRYGFTVKQLSPATVVFEYGKFQLHYKILHHAGDERGIYEEWLFPEDCKVIGNIHENPELL